MIPRLKTYWHYRNKCAACGAFDFDGYPCGKCGASEGVRRVTGRWVFKGSRWLLFWNSMTVNQLGYEWEEKVESTGPNGPPPKGMKQ